MAVCFLLGSPRCEGVVHISNCHDPSAQRNLFAGEIRDVLYVHPVVRVISFTGSTPVGKKLIAATAPHLKRLSLELGGNALFIVFDDAYVDRAVDQLMANKFRGAGQTCVCANRLYVQRGVAGVFAEKLANRVNSMTVGNGMEEGLEMGPLIDRNAFDKVRRHVDDAISHGAQRVAGTEPVEPRQNHSCFFPPTVLRGVTAEMECVNDETFGPLGPLIEFQDEAEVIEAANRTEYGFGREGDWKACMISSKHKQPLAHNVMLARKTSVREVDEISLKYSRRAKPTTFLSAWCVGRNQ